MLYATLTPFAIFVSADTPSWILWRASWPKKLCSLIALIIEKKLNLFFSFLQSHHRCFDKHEINGTKKRISLGLVFFFLEGFLIVRGLFYIISLCTTFTDGWSTSQGAHYHLQYCFFLCLSWSRNERSLLVYGKKQQMSDNPGTVTTSSKKQTRPQEPMGTFSQC